jgi:hypothetical protein
MWVGEPSSSGIYHGPSTTSPTFPVIQIPLPSGVDFSTQEYVDYDFELNLPPGPDFDAILVAGAEPPTNIQDIIRINISTTDNAELFENTTISTSPEWPGAAASATTTYARLDAQQTTFPGFYHHPVPKCPGYREHSNPDLRSFVLMLKVFREVK